MDHNDTKKMIKKNIYPNIFKQINLNKVKILKKMKMIL